MTPHRPFPTAVLATVLILLLAGCASLQDDSVDSGCAGRVDADSRPECASTRWSEAWKESQTMLPPAPQDEDLLPIEAPRAHPGYDYFIDRKSISRGADGVMRYTVVARSPSGTRNAFHEGLRCFDDTVRTYGFASSDGVLRATTTDQWRPLAHRGSRGYQEYLGNVIMCDRQGYAWDPDKAVKALTSQYTAGGVRIERQCMDLQSCGVHNRHD